MELTDLPIVTSPSKQYLNKRQLVAYREHREDFLEWLLLFGKTPSKAEGYSEAVVKNTAYRTDSFYRWIWNREGYRTTIAHDDANEYVRELAGRDISNSSKAKDLKALKRLFKWIYHEKGGEEWESAITFSEPDTTTQPKDFLTKEERGKIREAALEYGSVPSYTSLTPQERSRWKRYISQRLQKPKKDVGPEDWERCNDWKIPSLVWTSLDAGLRPIEVKRAKVSWIDVDNRVLRIPKEESSKSKDNWVVSLKDQTALSLDRWVRERQNYPLYDNTEALWLTNRSNPYQGPSLKYVLNRLCDIAEISTENRSITWYSIRHSVGTYLSREEGLAAAASQLRHKSIKTTMIYDNVPVEDRRDALNRIG